MLKIEQIALGDVLTPQSVYNDKVLSSLCLREWHGRAYSCGNPLAGGAGDATGITHKSETM
jgi:hypothetical protein